MTPLGLLGPLAPEWLRENKVVGCPHPHVPSGKSTHFAAFGVIHSKKCLPQTRSMQQLRSVLQDLIPELM
jgi:CCR4-NOT transcription complex subunit 6